MIREHDRVVLGSLFPITASSLAMLGSRSHLSQAGSLRGRVYNARWADRSDVTASADQIRPIGKREIPHARELAPG